MKRPLLLAVVVAAAVATGAAAFDAKSLVLQRSDMPSGAKRVSFHSSKGAIKIPRVVRGRAAYVGWRFKNGGTREVVAAGAGEVKTTRDAHDVFVYLRKLFRRPSLRRLFKVTGIPHYGDEQFALKASAGGLSSAVVIVRSGNRLWEVVVYGYPRFTSRRAIAELKKYASKEKSRAT